MSRPINGMVVAITGASAGIGQELARQLHARGAQLALAARRIDRLEEFNRELGGAHLCVQADVAKAEDCQRFVGRTFQRFGRLDTLVCNAGYGVYKRVEETEPEEVRRMFDVDVIGTTECLRHAIPQMEQQASRDGWRGQIMIVSSAAARRGTPFIGVYSGAKAAQLAIAEALRVELRDRRIAVTSVHPGPTKTEFREVAERLGKYRLPPSSQYTRTLSVEQVAASMLKAMEKPRPEVWPWRFARFALGFGGLMPSLMDRIMYKYYLCVLRHNERA